MRYFLLGFPYLDEEQLRNLTCGIYQLRLSPSYAQEHLEGNCQIHVHKEEPGLVRVRLQSRHVSSWSYQLWIRYDEASVQHSIVNAEPGQELLGCVPTLQPFYGFWEMRGTGSQVDLEFETRGILLTMQTTFQLQLMKLIPLRENLTRRNNDIYR